MQRHQISLDIKDSWNFCLARTHDAFLMDLFVLSNHFSDTNMINLNAVCLLLQQVATTYDVTIANRKSLTATLGNGLNTFIIPNIPTAMAVTANHHGPSKKLMEQSIKAYTSTESWQYTRQ